MAPAAEAGYDRCVGRGKRTLAGGFAAALAAAALASVAAAGSISDPPGDLITDAPSSLQNADVDLRHVSVKRANGKLVFTISVTGSIRRAVGNGRAAPAIAIFKAPKAWIVQRKGGKYGVFYAGNRLGANVAVAMPDDHTVNITFKTAAIGNPGGFTYHVTTGACTVYDVAPNSGLAASRVARRC